MMGRRRFVTRMIPTTLWTGVFMRGLSRNAEAKTVEQTSFKLFTQNEAEVLAAWCNVIVSGAQQAGVAQFVDQSLSGDQASSLLLLRYLNANNMADFYRKGILGIDTESRSRFGFPFLQLTGSQRKEMIAAAVASKMQVWRDPDPNFFYFISRSDAVDVVYGTQAGFADLGIPYLAHIPPPKPW
ncbi:gluconate 2-dehydrogenase subunit 3 family protein [Ruegeria lacuscaerulensis]|uniref:gluconate 2-dehydrogenase subunit 3 family protein n=1 Tax=Ruegeria lacuscaerulensis TaxID=55218 RepID=UPI00147B00D6|nr:gluconate 2-dehydrogenase subunit 3 family protein [Ruegeria lacuscaerulensis]